MSTVQFLGLYDGHGGAACADFAAAHLHVELSRAASFREADVPSALTEAFAACEAAFLAESESASGSCALVAVIGGGVLHVAHCGDSRAVLCTGDAHEALELTQDHKPDSEAERARIEAVRACLPLPPSCPVRLFLPLPPSLPLTCVLPLSIALARPLSLLSHAAHPAGSIEDPPHYPPRRRAARS